MRSEHFHDLDVGPAVQRAPQRADGRRAGGEQVGLRRAHHPHGRRAAILLVVAVEDEDQVQGVLHFAGDHVLLVRQREHHVQEVDAVAEVRVGIVERQALRTAVGEGGDGADLADQPRGRLFQRFFVLQGQQFLMIAGQVAQRGREDGHGRGVGRDVLELVLHPLVQQLVGGQQVAEPGQLLPLRLPPENQHPRHLDEAGLGGELLDGDAAIAEDALLAVDEGDGAAADARVAQGRVVGDQAGLIAQLGDVDGPLALGPHQDGQLDLLIVDGQDRLCPT